MIFLGTAASECFPNPFCECESCQKSRNSDDPKLTRRRSSFLIDDKNILDFNADVIGAVNQYKISLSSLENVFLTHTHCDHFDPWNIEFLGMSNTPTKPLNIYLSKPAYDGLTSLGKIIIDSQSKGLVSAANTIISNVNFIPMEPYKKYQIGEYTVSAVHGFHNGYFAHEQAFNYIFEGSDGKFMYATDTGLFLQESLDYLTDQKLDMLIIEGSFGLHDTDRLSGHLNFETLADTITALHENRAIDNNTKIYVTHIAHKALMTHYDYEDMLQSKFGDKVVVAYDGLEVNL